MAKKNTKRELYVITSLENEVIYKFYEQNDTKAKLYFYVELGYSGKDKTMSKVIL